MELRAERLAGHLEQQLLPVYLVSGDETLLVQECCDLVRSHARAAGCAERQVLEAGARDFNWQELLDSAAEMSLFAERKLIELRIPSGKPGAEGSKALCEYLERSGSEDVLLVVAGKVDKQSRSSKWFKALDGAGVTVLVWPVNSRDLPRWMEQRLNAAGLAIDREALQLLCERVEGNLLAAVQEIEKLKLLASDGRVTVDTVTTAVSDNARYDVFGMTDSALQGDAAHSLRMLQGLRAEGTEAAVVLWSLARELRTLYAVRSDSDAGGNVQRALGAQRVWKSRIPLMQAALSRHDRDSLAALLERAGEVDGSIKGYGDGNPWDQLETLVTDLCGPGAPYRGA
jgi:DNA polymerase-3 subunit delta